MSSPYRQPPIGPKTKPDAEVERFVDAIEGARIGALVEHARIGFAGLVAALYTMSWFYWGYSLKLPASNALEFLVWLGACVVFSLGFFGGATYTFHLVYRVTLGRRIPWPKVRDVLGAMLQ